MDLFNMHQLPKKERVIFENVLPEEKKLTGFVFKIQANMDPKHHDRLPL